MVIGAGAAGCCTALALGSRGLAGHTWIERHSRNADRKPLQPAGHSSYCKLSPHSHPAVTLFQSSYAYICDIAP